MSESKLIPAVVLDLDGTIRYNKDYADGFIEGPESIAIFKDVAPVLKRYRDEGFILLGVTNQGGAAYGYKTEDQIKREIERTLDLLFDQIGYNPFSMITYCPFMPGGNTPPYNVRSMLRKPSIGMLAVLEEMLWRKHQIMVDWDKSVMVGDREEDCALATAAHIGWVPADVFFGRTPKEMPKR